jgi:hypothetical protein
LTAIASISSIAACMATALRMVAIHSRVLARESRRGLPPRHPHLGPRREAGRRTARGADVLALTGGDQQVTLRLEERPGTARHA